MIEMALDKEGLGKILTGFKISSVKAVQAAWILVWAMAPDSLKTGLNLGVNLRCRPGQKAMNAEFTGVESWEGLEWGEACKEES